MLKGYRKIDKYLTDWCLANGFKVKCRLGSDFSYNSDSKVLNYAVVVPADSNEIFMDTFKNYLTEVKECDSFILSFFHELGHHETQEDFDDYEWCDYYDFTESFNAKQKFTKRDYKRYYMHPIELSATLWACDYINNNCEKVEEFFNGFKPLLLEFLNKNKVELE